MSKRDREDVEEEELPSVDAIWIDVEKNINTKKLELQQDEDEFNRIISWRPFMQTGWNNISQQFKDFLGLIAKKLSKVVSLKPELNLKLFDEEGCAIKHSFLAQDLFWNSLLLFNARLQSLSIDNENSPERLSRIRHTRMDMLPIVQKFIAVHWNELYAKRFPASWTVQVITAYNKKYTYHVLNITTKIPPENDIVVVNEEK